MHCFLLPAIFFSTTEFFTSCLYCRKAPQLSMENFSKLCMKSCPFFASCLDFVCIFRLFIFFFHVFSIFIVFSLSWCSLSPAMNSAAKLHLISLIFLWMLCPSASCFSVTLFAAWFLSLSLTIQSKTDATIPSAFSTFRPESPCNMRNFHISSVNKDLGAWEASCLEVFIHCQKLLAACWLIWTCPCAIMNVFYLARGWHCNAVSHVPPPSHTSKATFCPSDNTSPSWRSLYSLLNCQPATVMLHRWPSCRLFIDANHHLCNWWSGDPSKCCDHLQRNAISWKTFSWLENLMVSINLSHNTTTLRTRLGSLLFYCWRCTVDHQDSICLEYNLKNQFVSEHDIKIRRRLMACLSHEISTRRIGDIRVLLSNAW